MAKRRNALLIIAGIILIGAGVLSRMFFLQKKENKTIWFEPSNEVIYNPLMGYAPSADNPDAVGDNTLVYVDVTFRELEPLEGEFDFEAIEEANHLEQWREAGKRVVFRFVCDKPGDEAHRDVPDWLCERTSGQEYEISYGKGYAPDYSDEVFIKAHADAIQALGDRYGQDDFFAYIELGSLGHWGEWHVKSDSGMPPIPNEDVRERYIEPYRLAFPNAKILMRRPFAAAREYGFGVFNDMAGDRESTEEWLSWIKNGGDYEQTGEKDALLPIPKVWENAPIGGEFTSSLSMEWMLRFHLEETLNLIKASHMTFLGPKIPADGIEGATYAQGSDAVLTALGYRLRIQRADLRWNLARNRLRITLEWTNDGIAALYWDWPAYLYWIDDSGKVLRKEAVDLALSTLSGAKAQRTVNELDYTPPEETVFLCVGIEDPVTEKPAVWFAMEGERQGITSVLYQWN